MSPCFKIWFSCVILAGIWLGNADGLECYECAELHMDLETLAGMGFKEEDTCKYKVSEGLTTKCSAEHTFCIKGQGKVLNGKSVELRTCGSSEFKKLLIDGKSEKRNCRSTAELQSFKFTVGTQKLNAESGTLCICETDKCNHGTTMTYSSLMTMLAFSFAIYGF